MTRRCTRFGRALLPAFVGDVEQDRSEWAGIGKACDICLDPLADSAMEIACGWLKECVEHHTTCQKPAKSVLPTRVIDVGTVEELPRLWLPARATGHYATLSHCWGNIASLTTTTANLHQRTTRIGFKDMPSTFRDAVIVTRKLGLRYLWIDSLCILQNWEDD